MVLTLLKKADVMLKLKKRALFTNWIDYLGHVIKRGRLEVVSQSSGGICELEVPTTVTELRSFLGSVTSLDDLPFIPQELRRLFPNSSWKAMKKSLDLLTMKR